MNRRWLIGLALVLVLIGSACGDDELTLTEYVEQVNAAATVASARGAELVRDAAEIEDFSPKDVAMTHERALEEIRIPLQDAIDDIDPPEQVADLHSELWTWHARLIEIEQSLATVAATFDGTVAGWTAFSNTPEVAAYRLTLAEGKAGCDNFQAQMDATAARGVFADTPWLPGDLKETVVAALGCESFPENPELVYLYPPP
ncbi:MAG: hypothetical protein QNJ88_14885 [Acidimicrobiia bacterium]|nr:hypothetical protein [Acidimicrobiia bacterium]